MKKFLFLIVISLLLVSLASCKGGDLSVEEMGENEPDSTQKTTVNATAEPAAGTDLSVDEIVDLYNSSIKNAEEVTRIYMHAEYKNLDLSSEAFEAAVKSVLDETIKSNDVEYTATSKSETESILPKPCLTKSMIKEYVNTDGKISLFLYDIENPTDEGCLKLYSTDFISEMLKENNISIGDIKLIYTDCKINFVLDAQNKNVLEMSYEWCVQASGSFNLLFNEQNFGIDISVSESYKF